MLVVCGRKPDPTSLGDNKTESDLCWGWLGHTCKTSTVWINIECTIKISF